MPSKTARLPIPSAGYDLCTMPPAEMPTDPPACSTQLREALRGAASALKENGPRFALAGRYALWAYGAPEPSHDVDLVVAESDVADAVATLTDAGFAVERPRRIGCSRHAPAKRLLMCCTASTVCAWSRQPWTAPNSMMSWQSGCRCCRPRWCSSKSCAPWASIRAQTADNDYAAAFLVLVDRLGLTT